MTDHPLTATTIVVFCWLSLEEEEEEGSTITAVDYGITAVFDLACTISRFLAVIICD